MATDDKIRRETRVYYDERAEEYEEIYLGKRHTTIDPDEYKKDVTKAFEMVSRFGKGHLIDIACGTGFWLSGYARNCNQITFLDQSERMLSKCKERVEELGLINASRFIQGDFLDANIGTSEYDCALMGFFLSHLTLRQENIFFRKLWTILKTSPQLMLIDSVWNERRQQHREKEGIQERVLGDGRMFKIYKRYFEKQEVEEMLKRYDFRIESCYIGNALIAAVAQGQR